LAPPYYSQRAVFASPQSAFCHIVTADYSPILAIVLWYVLRIGLQL